MGRTCIGRCLLLLGALLLSSPVGAQDLWEISEGAETWEPLWDEGALLSPGRWTLSIRGGRRTSRAHSMNGNLEGRQQRGESYAVATLSMPLERFWGEEGKPRGTRLASREAAAEEESEQQTMGNEPGSEDSPGQIHDAPTAESEKEADVPLQAERAPKKRDMHSGKSRAGDDARRLLTLVSELTSRTGMSSGLRSAELRLGRLSKRARLSGLAPELRLRGVYGFDQTTSLEDAAGIIPGETTTRGGRDSLAEVRLTFHLERLLFSSQEGTLERARIQIQEDRRKAEVYAVDLFFKWKQADAQSRDEALFDEQKLMATLEAQKALSHLYLLTKGWFRGWSTLRTFGINPPEGE